MKHTLCWDCANSCGNCDWSSCFQPVEGWETENTSTGLRVVNCPEFKRDAYEGGTIRGKDWEKTLIRRQIRYEGKKSLHPITP